MKFNNIKPTDAAKFLEEHGWISINRKGTHVTFKKVIDGKTYFCQVICNSKTIYPPNVREMIRKSMIPEEKWKEHFT